MNPSCEEKGVMKQRDMMCLQQRSFAGSTRSWDFKRDGRVISGLYDLHENTTVIFSTLSGNR